MIPEELELYQVLSSGAAALDLLNLLHDPRVCRLVLLVLLVHLLAVLKIPAHLPGQLNMDHLRRAVFADNGVDDLTGLGNRPQDHGICDGLQFSLLLQCPIGERRASLCVRVSAMISIHSPGRLIIIDSPLQMGNQLFHGSQRETACLAERQRQQRLNHRILQLQLFQPCHSPLIGLEQAEDRGNGIQLVMGEGGDIPLPKGVQRLAELVVGLHLLKLRLLFRILHRIRVVADDIESFFFTQCQLFP